MELVKQFEECKSLFGSETAKKKSKFDFTNIYISEVEKQISKLMKKNISMKMNNDNFDFNIPSERCPKKLSQLLIMENNKMKEDAKEWLFITINPKDGISVEDFKNKILSLSKWKVFQKGSFVLEQRGENNDELGKGKHAHIMIEKYSIERKRLINRLETTFKNFCDKPYENTINVKRKSPEHGRETLDEYMNGLKQEDKLLKVENDIQWRKKYYLQDIYYWDITTDKISQNKPGDGRVSNGGWREGAGRKKTLKEKIEDKIEIENNKILEF